MLGCAPGDGQLLKFGSSLTRHDHHSVEFKSFIETERNFFKVETDLYLFAPRSVHMAAWKPMELSHDFRTRLRLSVPTQSDGGQSVMNSAIYRLGHARRENKNDFAVTPSETDFFAGEITSAAKFVAASFNELLKSLSRTSAESVATAQKVVVSIRHVARMEKSDAQLPVLNLLDEYVSYLYIQFLNSVKLATNEAITLEVELAEGAHRRAAKYLMPATSDESQFEEIILRVSHLKKFFQSDTYIEAERKKTGKRVTEPAAALGAALAGVWAIFFDKLNKPELVNFGFRGIFVLTFGVAAYVLKDRFKDKFKVILAKKAAKILADTEQHLYAHNKKIGRIKEWFSLKNSANLPKDILDARWRGCSSEVEKMLPEDVFHYRKIQDFERKSTRKIDAIAIQEIMRINLDRYLRYMDDPFKDFSFIDENDHLEVRKSHRVYHFYFGVKNTYHNEMRRRFNRITPSAPPATSNLQLFRIVMDKKGVSRIEEVSALQSPRLVVASTHSVKPRESYEIT